MTVLVLGVGNILLSDEGIGVRVVEAFQHRYAVPEGVEVVDGGTAGIDLLDLLAEHEHVIVVDAVSSGEAPGSVVRLAGDAVPAFFRARISPHQLGISDVLGALRLLDQQPSELVLIGIVPASLEMGLALSPPLAARLDELVEVLARELRGSGIPLTEIR